MPYTYRVPEEIFNIFKEIGDHLKYKNRFTLPHRQTDFVNKFVEYHLKHKSKIIKAESSFYRARIEKLYQESAYEATNKDMGAPPKGSASSGRLNPEGISYLYLASKIDTAISEVRPWKGANVSVATFKTAKELKVISLTGSDSFTGNLDNMEDMSKLFASSIIKGMYFSAPVHSDDKLAYLASQYIAEQIKIKEIDGIEYFSVLNEKGVNIAFFDTDAASCSIVKRFKVDKVEYTSSKL